MEIQAQDPRFSQFYMAPLQLNPAMTGLFPGQLRVHMNYRNQWSSILGGGAFKTISAGVDYKYRIFGGDFVSMGMTLLNDKAGESHFTQNRGHLSLAYHKQIVGGKYSTQDQYLIAGGSFGMGQFSLDYSDLWFPTQFDFVNNVPNPSSPNGESFNQKTNSFIDVNAGLMYYALFDEDASIYLGGALYHVNQPVISFADNGNEKLYQRIIVHGGGQIPINNQLSVLPSAVVMKQGPYFEILGGGNIRYSNNDRNELAIRGGLHWRLNNVVKSGLHSESLVFSSIFEYNNNWSGGISYDVNVSSLKKASNSRGAWELSLIYTRAEKVKYKINCPVF